ncbi:MAG: Maf family protein [Calditrichia bacterium]
MKFISLLCRLEDKRVVLATQSPRRIELLRSVGLEFEIYPPRIEEKLRPGVSPVEYVRHNAGEKANWVSQHVNYDLIISADTVVTLNDKIFEKPDNVSQAEAMLRELSNQTHQVITGFCLRSPSRQITDHEITRVTFYPLSEEEIHTYLQSDEPFDKAGAYGIQGFASLFIRHIEGCYFNVVGFPLGKFYQRLKSFF